MSKFITEYFWVFFILGILEGLFLPFSSLITPYMLYMLMFVLFLSCLKIDMGEMFRKIKDLKLVIYLVVLILIVVPILVYFLFANFLEPEYSLAVLILLTMPAGMTNPVLANIFKGDIELALILSVITSLLCPLTIPILIYFLAGIKTNINFFQMFTTLSIIIFIPFILSMIFRKIGRNFIINTEKYYSPLSILIMMLLIAGAIAKVDVMQIINSEKSIIYPFLSLFILAALLFMIGYYAVYKKDKETKIASSLAMANMNSTLAIIFAAKFFGPKTLLLIAFYFISGNLILIGFGHLAKKNFYNSIKA